MGRHRRSAAGRAATGRAAQGRQTDGTTGRGHDPQAPAADKAPTMGIAPYLNPEAYAEARAKSDAYLFAEGQDGEGPQAGRTVAFPAGGYTPDGGSQPGGGRRRRRRKAATPVRAGLLGVSAAVAIGTVAVATGVVPGLDNYRMGGAGGGDQVHAQDVPTNSPSQQGGTSGSADTGRGDDAATSRGADRSSSSPSRSAPSPSKEEAAKDSPSSSPSSASPSASAPATRPAAPAGTPSKTKKPKTTPSTTPKPTPSRPATGQPTKPSAPAAVSEQAVAEAQVLKLVNDERAKVGCTPVAANSALRELAEDFSEAMATQGFFDHTDPGGATPWDRAAAAGISGLGGENIARGQADAQAVMDAWMNSPDHRANILNCDFKTLGVGVHFGSGGPWWTQDFGY
ncbi:CAP domain-containing protein [Streptomyces violaceorubidus]|uniref:CAP domain-containing protein n=1 Tax=Streptomyces violaceorubidus TaxID=284042 RepID=UPI0004C00042|nr:CAP domain-containing protein [Streptomyces violaceorubidus]